MLLIAARDTGRSTLLTVTVNDFESDVAPSLTLIETVAVPASEKPGARARLPAAVPVPGVVVVTVAYVGRTDFENVSPWPSASVA